MWSLSCRGRERAETAGAQRCLLRETAGKCLDRQICVFTEYMDFSLFVRKVKNIF